MSGRRKRKVAILGGGPAGLAAAWELTQPSRGGRFEVTVYEQGWRLGGKGASSRDRSDHDRILEHGLHIWFGFYDDALNLVKRTYEELAQLGEPVPFEPWTEAFVPVPDLGLWHQNAWWRLPLPAHHPFEPRKGWVATLAQLLGDAVRAALPFDFIVPLEDPFVEASELPEPQSADELEEQANKLADAAEQLGEGEGWPSEIVGVLGLPHFDFGLLKSVARFCKKLIHAVLEEDLLLFPGGWNDRALAELDKQEWTDWLSEHRMAADVDEPYVTAVYDLAFGYERGDPAKRCLAAGMATRNLFRILSEHRGTFAVYLGDGMGDVVFAPLYRLLHRRGVKFRFFSAVTALHTAEHERRIGAIDLCEQPKPRGGSYEPLDGRGAWPPEPLWDRLEEPADDEADPEAKATTRLKRGHDFHDVVLAIPVGALKPLCEELCEEDLRFAQMLDDSSTVATQAVQLWLKVGADLGPKPSALTGGYPKPFDTCADMRHLIARERWKQNEIEQIAYLCSVLKDGLEKAAVEQHARDTVTRRGIDPNAIIRRYTRPNVSGSERYVLSPPGRIRSRLAPDESHWTNLVFAGDWTRTEVNAGCFEAAIASGRDAARALARPRYVEFGGLRSVPVPLQCQQAVVYYFWAPVDGDRVGGLCRRVFDEPTNGAVRCTPLLNHVAISFGVMKVVAEVPPYDGLGFVVERHAAIWVPVHCPGVAPHDFAAFIPAIWVDNPMSIAVGHDVFGYPKNEGWPRFEGDGTKGPPTASPAGPERYTLSSWSIPTTGGNAYAGANPLLEIARQEAAAPTLSNEETHGHLGDVAELVRQRLGRGRKGLADARTAVLTALGTELRLTVPQLFLRQFRAPDGGMSASTQQVVLADARVVPGSLRVVRLGTHHLTVHDVASEGLADVGLGSGPIDVGVRVSMDFIVEPGKVVWDASS